MWPKLLNLFFIQLFILQASAFASPAKYFTASQLEKAVSVLKNMSPEDHKRLYLSIMPLVNKANIDLVEDMTIFDTTIKNLSVEGDNLIVKTEKGLGVVSDIDFLSLTAKLNGKILDLKKPIQEQLHTFLDTEHKTSALDFFISSAQAQEPVLLPNKLAVLGILVGAVVVAILAVGGVLYAWLKNDKGTETVAIREVKSPVVEELIVQDCNKSKDELKKGRLGEIPRIRDEFIQRIRDKSQMMDKALEEAKKLKMTPDQMKWISNSKDCYNEVIEMVQTNVNNVADDSSRGIKQVTEKVIKKVLPKKATKQ